MTTAHTIQSGPFAVSASVIAVPSPFFCLKTDSPWNPALSAPEFHGAVCFLVVLYTVIRRFLGDVDIMRMALSERCRRDLDKSAVFLQFIDRVRTAVAHTGTDAANELEYGILNGSLVGNAAFHAFRNQLLRVGLEVTVLAAVFHGGDGSHAAVNLIFSSLIQFEGSGTLVTACEDASHHADVSAGGDSLCHVSGILDAA